jgi:hypothetical protein
MGNHYGKWDGEAALIPKQAIKEDLGGCLCEGGCRGEGGGVQARCRVK